MGHFAQARKRGFINSPDSGLPAGPSLAKFSLSEAESQALATWVFDGPNPGQYWRSRWRVPSISGLWTESSDVAKSQLDGQVQTSPFPWQSGQQQDCECMFCTVDGTPLSQWSAYASITK